jgi:hypothetical protein
VAAEPGRICDGPLAAIKLAAACGIGAVMCLPFAGCGGSSAKQSDPRPPAKAIPTPTLAQQVRRAERVGPGFLDYCPMRPGRARARFQVDVPGSPIVPGWCLTTAKRDRLKDVVTFRTHWDARRVKGPSGTVTFTYSVPHTAVPGATPAAELVGQSGQLPP